MYPFTVRNLATFLTAFALPLLAAAQNPTQSQFVFYGNPEGSLTAPLNQSPFGSDNPDYGNATLSYSLDDLHLTVSTANANCIIYQAVAPDFGGLGVYRSASGNGNCGTNAVDASESISLHFNRAVNLSGFVFFTDHQTVAADVSVSISIDDGAPQAVQLESLQNDLARQLTGTRFRFSHQSGARFHVGGFNAAPADIIIEAGDCSGDVGCTFINQYGFTSTITNAPEVQGSLRLKPPQVFIDPRSHCGGSGWPSQTLNLNLNQLAGGALTGDVLLPAHLCGIPTLQGDGSYAPEIILLEIISSLNLREELIIDELVEPSNTDYTCASEQADASAPFTHPLLAWLPRPNTDEIPILGTNGLPSDEVRVINIGCGSLRAGVGQRSYFIYNLHYAQASDFRQIISREIAQLRATVGQAEACMASNGVHTSTLSALVKSIESGFAHRQYTNKVEPKLQALALELNGTRLRAPLADCYWDPDAMQAVYADAGTDLKPRNFRGDLLGQTLHLQYQVDAMILLRAQGI